MTDDDPSGASSRRDEAAVLRRGKVALAGSALGALLAVASEIVGARFLGVEAYGLYAVSMLLARVCECIAVFGLPIAIIGQLSVYRNQGALPLVRGTIIAAVVPPVVVGGLLCVSLWHAAPAISEELGQASLIPFIRAAALAVPFMALSETFGAVTRGLGHAWHYVLIRNVVPPVVLLGLVIVISRSNAEPAAVAAAVSSAYAVAAIVGFACVLSAGRGRLVARPLRADPGRLYGQAFPVLLNNLLYLVVGCTSIAAVALWRTDAETGIIRACVQMLMPFEMVELAFLAALGGTYAVMASTGQKLAFRALVERSSRWICIASLLACAAGALVGGDLLRIMGAGFEEGVETLVVLLVGQSILLCTGSLAIGLVTTGHPRVETGNVAVAAVICVLLNALWVPGLGTLGAALATAVPCLVVSGLRVVQAWRIMGIAIWRSTDLRSLAAPACAIGLLVLGARYSHVAGEWSWTAACIRLLVAGPGLAAFAWCFMLQPGERTSIVTALLLRHERNSAP